ncbi:hypothetical protein ACFP3U_23080 [Kitasatospora misakiensis]|uniref:Gram-positive cocci surface proteins LPxTG domain-containing protein n=1 Tax=Kitasatospora misakiensis TaxID=67330 RepID=A0ABW0X7W3_9ACTN
MKNTVVHRRVAAVAATLLLAGSVQLLTAESSWACGAAGPVSAADEAAAVAAESADHHGDLSIAFKTAPEGQHVTAGGKPLEVSVSLRNSTGAPYQRVRPLIALDSTSGNRISDFTVEAATPNGWKKLPLQQFCDPVMWADTSSLISKNLADGQTADFRFRITVSGKAVDLKSFNVGTSAKVGPATHGLGANRTFAVDHPTAPKPAPTSKPAPAKETAKPAAPAAPKSTPTTAPATTAPAGTPELAQTGAGTPNGLLAGIAAGIAALGAGMVLTVRRLRAQR